MFKNYLTIVIRNFRKQQIYSAINIAGLSLGLACAVVVLLIIKREYAVNRNFSKAEQIYRVSSEWKAKGMGNSISTLARVGPLLNEAFAEVEDFNRFWGGWVVLNVGEKAFREDMLIADPSFFHLFDFPFLAGDPGTAFQQPNSVVITEDLAQKTFGTTNVLGQTIAFQLWSGEGKREYKVTGVLKKLPRTTVTHFSDAGFTVFISTRNLEDFLDRRGFESWNSRYIVTYILLQPGTDVKALQTKLPALLDEHCPEDLRPNIELKLEPITKIHLTDFGGQVQKTLNGYVFFAVLMILIACFNFINLSTARAAQRAKEIGVHKVLGSACIELVKQFLTEALVFAILALLLSLGLVEVFISTFRDSVVRDLSFNILAQADVLPVLLGLLLVTGLLAGAYPAFFLSSFHPVQAIRRGLGSGQGPAAIRKILVTAQFSATVFLIIAAAVISWQLYFMMNRDLGFERENVLVIQSIPREWNFNGVKKQEVLKDAILKLPDVSTVSLSFDVPADHGSGALDISTPYLSQGQTVTATQFTVDESYLQAFDLKLAAGRFFSKEYFQADTTNAIVINQAAAEALALQNPVGETVTLSGGHDFRVIGVVKNFSFSPLHGEHASDSSDADESSREFAV